jgi:hypothetical protein
MASDNQPTRQDYENAAKRMVEAAVKQLASNLTVDGSKPVGVTVDGSQPLSADKVVFTWDSVPAPFIKKEYTMSSRTTGPYPLPGPPLAPPKLPTYKYSDDTEITPERLLQFGFQANSAHAWLDSPDRVTTLRVMLGSWTWLLDVRDTPGNMPLNTPLNPPQDMGDVQRLVDALGLRQPTHPSVARVVRDREEETRTGQVSAGWTKTVGRLTAPVVKGLSLPAFPTADVKVSPTCGHCNGTGRQSVTSLEGTLCSIICPYCHGTGTV